MQIDSKDRKLKEIFSRKKYIIPEYQRDYSWEEKEEVSIFWDDFSYFLDKKDKESFFLGPMVFRGDNGIDSEIFEVIDGQQRLITVSILMSVIVNFFKKVGKNDLADGLKDYLIFNDLHKKEQVVIETEEPHPFYQSVVFSFDQTIKPNDKKKSEKRIDKARRFFDKKIQEKIDEFTTDQQKIKYLEKIRDYLMKIDIVIIVSDKDTDAFTIFETINTRGKNLSSLDLLKNYIFKNFNKKPGIKEPKKTWVKIQKNISKESDKFFNRFWSSWVLKITENKLFRRFVDYMQFEKNNKFKDVNDLFDKLALSSETYRKILSPMIDDWKINKNYSVYYTLRNLVGQFNVKVPIPFLLALIEEFDCGNIKKSLFVKTLDSLEGFHFIFSHIVSLRASGLDGKYSKFAILLRDAKKIDKPNVIKQLLEELYKKIPSLKEYREKFIELNYLNNKNTIKYFLLKLEKERNPATLMDLEENSIEHLYPKKLPLKNKDDVGNLFLLESSINEIKADTKPFEEIKKIKKTSVEYIIAETKYQTTKNSVKDINFNKSWDENDISNRTEQLVKDTYKLFSEIKI